jgi:hypothetical protein
MFGRLNKSSQTPVNVILLQARDWYWYLSQSLPHILVFSMATDPFPQHLPTLDRLGVFDPSNVSSSEIAAEWLNAFSAAITQSDTAAIVDLFLEDGFWKDVIALTWDLRTFRGRNDIKKLLDARLAATRFHELCLLQEPLTEPVLQNVFPDFAWLRFCFGFTTKYGKGTGVVYLVPLPDSKWKAYTLLTCLDSLIDFPQKVRVPVLLRTLADSTEARYP